MSCRGFLEYNPPALCVCILTPSKQTSQDCHSRPQLSLESVGGHAPEPHSSLQRTGSLDLTEVRQGQQTSIPISWYHCKATKPGVCETNLSFPFTHDLSQAVCQVLSIKIQLELPHLSRQPDRRLDPPQIQLRLCIWEPGTPEASPADQNTPSSH